MSNNSLSKTAHQMVKPGKGILASDESINSANKTLSKNGIEPTEENRRRYREVFIGTKGIGKYLNGIILSEETLEQRDSNDVPFRETLEKEKILIGVKVDRGVVDLPGFPNEKFTTGLDNLNERLKQHYDLGARFAKWRSIIRIGDNIPTDEGIFTNAHGLALYASLCIKNNIVPIVEPEVLLNGDHSIEECYKVTSKVLKEVFSQLTTYKVDLSAVILKPNMILPGKDSSDEASDPKIAKATVECLKESVPKEVPGIVFLSGGQTPDEATHHLNEIAKLEPLPWEVTFSFLRAIEGPATQVWAGKDENLLKARVVFEQKLKESVAAEKGLLKD